MKHLLRITSILALLSVVGCSWFSWIPGVGGEKKEDPEKPVPLVEFAEEADVVRLWQASVGKGLGRKYLRLSPAILADRVFAADAYGAVAAFDRFTGRNAWRTSVGKPDGSSGFKFWDRRDPSFVTGGVGAAGGRVLIGTTRGEVVALDAADGVALWRSDVSSEVLSPPVGSEGLVVVQTADGRIAVLDGANGAPRWSFDTEPPPLTLRGTAVPSIWGELVYAGFANGKVTAFRAADGEPIWEQRVMLPEGRSELGRMVDVDGSPLLLRGVVYAVSFQGRLKAFRATDGAQLWEIAMSSFLDLAEGYGQIYVVTDEDVVSAIEQADATLVWQQEGLRNRRLTSPLAFGNYVLVGDSEGYLHVLAQSDGRFIARRKVGDGVRSGMIVADNVVYVLTNDGRLNALEIRRRT